jgi:spore germination protein GerM
MKRWVALALATALALAGCTGKSAQPAVTAPKTSEPPVVTAPKMPDPPAVTPPAVTPPKTPDPQVSANCAAATADALTKPGVVSVFFTCSADSMSNTPRPVERRVPTAGAELKFALEELLKGPTAQERAAGFSSYFSDATAGMLKSVAVSEAGRAVVDLTDFSARVNNASTGAGAAQLTGELNKTVFQFKQIKEVEYRFDGNCDGFWNWLQRDCHVVTAAEANK